MTADNSDIEAMRYYGLMLYNEKTVPVNIKERLEYLQMSTDRGHLDATYFYGQTFTTGKYIAIDMKIAFKYFKIA